MFFYKKKQFVRCIDVLLCSLTDMPAFMFILCVCTACFSFSYIGLVDGLIWDFIDWRAQLIFHKNVPPMISMRRDRELQIVISRSGCGIPQDRAAPPTKYKVEKIPGRKCRNTIIENVEKIVTAHRILSKILKKRNLREEAWNLPKIDP